MSTISIADLKTHLSAELKKVQAGAVITVLDHKRPVAEIRPISEKNDTGFVVVKPAVSNDAPKVSGKRLYQGTREELMRSWTEDRDDRW
jgi:antitoxin (DNA-binding transcriptional repressor) of toxin-antitoxin stability system